MATLRFIRNLEAEPLRNLIFQFETNHDHRILGHLPYNEIHKDKLVLIEPNIEVHIDMRDSLVNMREEAKKDGIYLVFLSGFRSINLQNEIFYSLKSFRNQEAAERARVSAPPGYSEHSTGFAIDIGDATKRETDFETEFENTDAFKWLIKNAAAFFINHLKASVFSNSVSKSVSLLVASPISIAKPVLCSEYPGGAETLALSAAS